MRPVVLPVLLSASWLALSSSACGGTFSFVPGNFYLTADSQPIIYQFDSNGQRVAQIATNSASKLTSLAFGPDHNLYLLGQSWDQNWNYSVEIQAFNKLGQLQMSYPLEPSQAGSEILFDDSGHFYSGTQRFTIGDLNSGQEFFPAALAVLVRLDNGHFLAREDTTIYELNEGGDILREIFNVSTGSRDWLGPIAYDSKSNVIYAAGGADWEPMIWKVDFDSGAVLASTSFPNCTDLVVALDGSLLATSLVNYHSWLLAPDLQPVLGFNHSSPHVSAVQFVPEPSTMALAGLGLVVVIAIATTANEKGT